MTFLFVISVLERLQKSVDGNVTMAGRIDSVVEDEVYLKLLGSFGEKGCSYQEYKGKTFILGQNSFFWKYISDKLKVSKM